MKKTLRTLLFVAGFTIISCKKNTVSKPVFHWTQINIPYFGQSTDIQFTGKDTGYILGIDSNSRSTLIRTFDGGSSWQTIVLTDSFLKDTAKGNFMKISVADYNASLLISGSNNILRSLDGGVQWNVLTSAVLTPPTAISYHFTTGSIVGCGQKIYRSIDGGSSWTTTYDPDLYNFVFSRMQFTGNNTAYCSGGTVYDGLNYGSMASSTDAGNTWKPLTYPTGNAVTGMYFLDDNKGFISLSLYKGDLNGSHANGSALYKTVNGGSSWEVVNPDLGLPEHDEISDLHFINDQEGYGCGGYGFYHTRDGGLHWDTENPSIEGIAYQMASPGNSVCYLLDHDGHLFKRTF